MLVNNIYFELCSFLYMISLLILILYKRKHIPNKNLYISMISSNIVGILLNISSIFTIININSLSWLNLIITRLNLIYMLLWITLFAIYILSNPRNNKKQNIVFLILFIIISILLFILPLNYYNHSGKVYFYGLGVKVVYIVSAIYILICICFLVFNLKTVKKEKYVPLISYLLLFPTVLILQAIKPEMLLIPTVYSFITFLCYFININLVNNNIDKNLTFNIKHSLITDLNVILGISQSLKLEKGISRSIKTDIDDIILSSNNILRTLNEFTDIIKLKNDELDITCEEYNFKILFEKINNYIKTYLNTNKIKFSLNIDDMQLNLYGDSVRLEQVLENILIDLCDNTKRGNIELTALNNIEDDTCNMIITLKVNGTFDESKILDLYQNNKEYCNDNLDEIKALSNKKIIEAMNGSFKVISKSQSEIEFILDIEQKVKKVLNENNEAEIIEIIDDYDISKKKILVVDDNRLNLKVITKLLKNYNVDVEQVESGKECINLIKNFKDYSLILLDEMMPHMSGVETLKELKKIEGYKAITIACVANSLQKSRKEYLGLGFDDYLEKPVQKEELDKIIAKYL